jgi:hypothetical protein
MTDEKIFEACCPECGSHDVDLSFSLNPIEDGVKCYDCNHIYKLGADTGIEIGQEGLDKRMKEPGWFSWTNNLRDMLGRILWN